MSSIKATRDAIKAIPYMTAVCADGEWRVTINLYRLSERYPDKGVAWCDQKQEEMAYYTNDADDALETAKAMSGQWAENRTFFEVLCQETGLPLRAALQLNGQIQELAAQHFVLAGMGTYGHDGLTSKQENAVDAIEKRIGELVSTALGVKGARFTHDPRGATVGIEFESGAHDSLTGSYKVPLDEARVQALNNESFWEAYPMPTLYVSVTIEETGNAAFVDVGRSDEISRILNVAADRIEAQAGLWGTAFPLHDMNGNRVGQVDVLEQRPEGALANGAARLVIETGNAAFDDDAVGEVAHILRDAAQEVGLDNEAFALSDYNGNVVGNYEYRGVSSLEHDGVIDMKRALSEGRVYLAEDGYSGIAEDTYRFVVTGPDFEPGYGQGSGEVWLVNAKGEIASGYEDREEVREDAFDKLPKDMAAKLNAVVAGSLSFEDFEREFGDDDLSLG